MPQRAQAGCLTDYWSGRASCVLCRRNPNMPFSALVSTQLDRRLHPIDVYRIAPGVKITTAGDPADAVFTLREGFVKIWRRDSEGACRILRLLRPGDFVGLEALAQSNYTLSAASLSQASLCGIPVDLLHRLEDENNRLYREIQARWHSQLDRTDELVSIVLSGQSRTRVIKLLRYLADFAAPQNVPRIRRTDMAAMLDISSETAARVIADLKQAGLLTETPTELLFDPATLPD